MYAEKVAARYDPWATAILSGGHQPQQHSKVGKYGLTSLI